MKYSILSILLGLTSVAFANNCPVQKLKATLVCEGAQNALKFTSHIGTYHFEKSDIFKDMTGREELECTYAPKEWQSNYLLKNKEFSVQNIEGLFQLVRSVPDFTYETDKVVAIESIRVPYVNLNYSLSLFGMRKKLANRFIHVGLGSHWDEFLDGDETPKQISFVVDKTADSISQGRYTVGTKCSFNIEVQD